MTPAALKLVVAAVTATATLALPPAAGAATLTVTDDSGQAVQMVEGTPTQMRNMSPVLVATFSGADKRYTFQVGAPNGKTAFETVCADVGDSPTATAEIPYTGNGTYPIKLVTFGADDFNCENPTLQSFSLVINASVTLSGLTSPLLFRDPGDSSKDLAVKYDVNPGASRYFFAWAFDAKFGPGGEIIGEYPKDSYGERSFGGPTGTWSDLRFTHTGVVSIVAAAETIVGNRSPFSAPLTVKLIAPFDWSSTPGITGGRVGRLRIEGEVYEPTVVGNKVSVLMAKGSGKFKPFLSVTIPASRKFGFKFKPKKPGKYRLQYVYKGSEFMVPGTWAQTIKINKRRNASLSGFKRVV